MLSKVKCEITWVPYIAFTKKLTTVKDKDLKSSAKRHIITQQKIHILMFDFNLPKKIEQMIGLNFLN